MSADDDEASQVPEWFEKLPPEMQAMYVRLGLAPDDWYPGGADAAAQMDPISGTYNRMAQDLWIWSAIPGGTLPYYGVAAAYQLERPGDYTRYLSQTESSEAYYAARGEPYGIGRQGEPVGYLVEESRAGYYQTEAALAPWKAVYDLAKLASYVAPGAGMARAGLLAPYTFGLDIMAGQAEAPYLRTIGQMFGPTAEMDVIRSSQIFYGYQFPQMADVGTGVLEWAGGWALMRAAGSPVAALSALESGNFGYFQGGAGLSLLKPCSHSELSLNPTELRASAKRFKTCLRQHRRRSFKVQRMPDSRLMSFSQAILTMRFPLNVTSATSAPSPAGLGLRRPWLRASVKA
jgi:hypothetical protein